MRRALSLSAVISVAARQLRRLPHHRLVLAVLAPVLALVAFSAYVVHEKLETYTRSADLLSAAQSARAAQELARELENERNLSALFLSTDRQSWREDLEEQREATDERAESFRAVLLGQKAPPLFDRQRMGPGLDRLEALRAAVDGDGDLRSMLDGYGGLIASMIASSAKLPSADLSMLIAAYVDLGQMKDRVSRERSIGASWLLQQRKNRDLLILFTEAEAEHKAFGQSFRTHASPRQLDMFDQTVSAELLIDIDRLHRNILAARLGPDDVEAWHRAHLAL
ncbi:MAG TPA: nitrate- and nitrite sensing domain-containing protein, partial [Magnetospirillum sp.]|nr:nitrate- and nitrite sensing domain-containing protein [Magnetospirillum sp.]